MSDVIHRPQHPYTVGLMGSIPTFGHETERLTQIDGSMPRLTAIPSGCAFIRAACTPSIVARESGRICCRQVHRWRRAGYMTSPVAR